MLAGLLCFLGWHVAVAFRSCVYRFPHGDGGYALRDLVASSFFALWSCFLDFFEFFVAIVVSLVCGAARLEMFAGAEGGGGFELLGLLQALPRFHGFLRFGWHRVLLVGVFVGA